MKRFLRTLSHLFFIVGIVAFLVLCGWGVYDVNSDHYGWDDIGAKLVFTSAIISVASILLGVVFSNASE
jgi:hypothetical protein